MPQSKPYHFHPAAWDEFEAAQKWYRSHDAETGLRFLAAIYDALEDIALAANLARVSSWYQEICFTRVPLFGCLQRKRIGRADPGDRSWPPPTWILEWTRVDSDLPWWCRKLSRSEVSARGEGRLAGSDEGPGSERLDEAQMLQTRGW
jgi:hypothetical protein